MNDHYSVVCDSATGDGRTAEQLYQVLELMAQLGPGSLTVNQLRIGQYIGWKCETGEPVGVTEVASALDIPLSTVSRHVAELLEKRFVKEHVHPQDRRRRVLCIHPEFFGTRAAWYGQLQEILNKPCTLPNVK